MIGAIALDWLRLQRAKHLDRDRLRSLQERKLRSLVTHAYSTVAYYRRLFDQAGVHPEQVRTLDDLARLPVTTRAALQTEPAQGLLSTAYRDVLLETVRTTGSTGRPFTVRCDPAFQSLRKALFLRALAAGGYRPGNKLVLLADPHPRRAPAWTRWHYLPRDGAPERTLQILNRIRPAMLYGPVTPLRRLVDVTVAEGRPFDGLRSVFTTAESLDDATRRRFSEVLGEVFDIYGSTELGTIAWECRAHGGYHVADETTILELLPATSNGPCRVVATSLELRSMPLIRYDTGDLARAAPGKCDCGRTLVRLARIEGRLVDCIRLADGRLLSPYVFTERIEDLPGIERYQLVQEALDRFTLRAQGPEPSRGLAAALARGAIGEIAGTRAEVAVVWEASLEPRSGRKFRVVESRLAADEGP